MKKIYESPLNGWGECAERIHIYELESEEESWNLVEMSHKELQEYFGMYDPGFDVPPGAMYSIYNFSIERTHAIVSEIVAFNV